MHPHTLPVARGLDLQVAALGGVAVLLRVNGDLTRVKLRIEHLAHERHKCATIVLAVDAAHIEREHIVGVGLQVALHNNGELRLGGLRVALHRRNAILALDYRAIKASDACRRAILRKGGGVLRERKAAHDTVAHDVTVVGRCERPSVSLRTLLHHRLAERESAR